AAQTRCASSRSTTEAAPRRSSSGTRSSPSVRRSSTWRRHMPPPRVDDPFAADRLNGVGDFYPDWDVPTLGKQFTEDFSAAIDELRAHPQPDPRRKVRAFVGPAGYGKTHLFGRLQHQQRDRVNLAFIAA